MKTIQDWQGLQEYGIQYLTGESCAYSMRVLCDLNEKGKGLIQSFFGLTMDNRLNDPWNHEVNGLPSVASVMLDTTFFRRMAVFCLLNVDEFPIVLELKSGVVIGYSKDRYAELKQRDSFNEQIQRCYIAPQGAQYHGGRAVHQMSGRAL